MTARLQAGLLLLAGGRSSRMGREKATLQVGERALLGWQLERLRPHFAEAMVSLGERELALPEGVRAVRDLHLGRGPLGGLEAGLAAASQDAVFALAVDMPLAPPELARLLLERSRGRDAAVPLLPAGPEPLAAVYRQSGAAEVALALGEARLALRQVLERLDCAYVEGLDPAWFSNLNTPEDYRAFLADLPGSA